MIWATIALQAASTLMSAYSSAAKGAAQAKQYQYQAGIARMNQQIAKQNAEWARLSGEVEAQEAGLKTRAQVGQTKAIQSGRGLDVNVGSPADVRESEIEVGQQNEAIIRSNAARRAFGFEIEGANKQAEALMYESAAGGARTAGYLGMGESILGGATSVASKWMDYKRYYPDRDGGGGGDYGDSGADYG